MIHVKYVVWLYLHKLQVTILTFRTVTLLTVNQGELQIKY